jgi:hypothetical protein
MNSEAVGLMLYPRLMSFPDLDSERPVDDLFVLSHAAVDQNSQQLYLLDSLTELLVYYPRAAKGSVPFPPPVDSGIRYASLICYSRHTARHNPALFPLLSVYFFHQGASPHLCIKRVFLMLGTMSMWQPNGISCSRQTAFPAAE